MAVWSKGNDSEPVLGMQTVVFSGGWESGRSREFNDVDDSPNVVCGFNAIRGKEKWCPLAVDPFGVRESFLEGETSEQFMTLKSLQKKSNLVNPG